jgi:hypothetical protein
VPSVCQHESPLHLSQLAKSAISSTSRPPQVRALVKSPSPSVIPVIPAILLKTPPAMGRLLGRPQAPVGTQRHHLRCTGSPRSDVILRSRIQAKSTTSVIVYNTVRPHGVPPVGTERCHRLRWMGGCQVSRGRHPCSIDRSGALPLGS